MKSDKFETTQLSTNRVQIIFKEQITEDDLDLTFILDFFKKKKRVRFYYKLKPKIVVEGVSCTKKMWAEYLVYIQKKNQAKTFYESMRDVNFASVEDFRKVLLMLKEAEIRESLKHKDDCKEHAINNDGRIEQFGSFI